MPTVYPSSILLYTALECGGEYFTMCTIERMRRCRHYLELVADRTLEKKKITACEACGSPWCPACMLAQARKDAARIAVLMKWVQLKHGKDFLFLTLTTPNVTGEALRETINEYNLNFKKLTKRREVEGVIKGYVRKLEITYNKEPTITRDMWYGNKERHIRACGKYFKSLGLRIGDANPNFNTYHPHFHVLIAVDRTYFDSRHYINRQTWLRLWREVMNDQSITQVDVRRVTPNVGREIGEVAKYAAKDSDYAYSPEVFAVYYRALNRRQKTTYPGLFAEANKLYKQKDKEIRDLREKDMTEYVYRLFYEWDKDGYLLTDMRELEEWEKTALFGQPIEEMDIED